MHYLKPVKSILLIVGLFLVASLSSCKDDDDEVLLEINERIVGKWTVAETVVLGFTVPGDGSYVTFNACSGGTCTGTDYLAEDESTGTFTYEFKSSDTILSIDDTDPEGGGYDGEWTIVSFSNSELNLTASTILGEVRIKFKK
ncbi:hypothetical protein [Fulvivirga lutimaris]|uniref:hypothetical protein n=1 Tax=Fulvivirga lutimaris TaxID=1819566 RepID=UPI0012BD5DE0|nr:hypothetical protein [Fulvivirga lutimaris]MTI39491.1 hypothetical protein [Fulvivirga lutimaris]